MKNTTVAVAALLLLAACGDNGNHKTTNEQAPANQPAIPATSVDRDKTPQTTTGGDSEVNGNGTTSR